MCCWIIKRSIWSIPNWTQCVSETVSKDRAGEGGNHFNGISEGKMLATVGLLQASWEAQAESWRQVTAQPQEPVGFVSCLYISLGILYEILVSGLNLDPIDNLSFFVEKSRFNQTSTPPATPIMRTIPQCGLGQILITLRPKVGHKRGRKPWPPTWVGRNTVSHTNEKRTDFIINHNSHSTAIYYFYTLLCVFYVIYKLLYLLSHMLSHYFHIFSAGHMISIQ